jgi:hypothetical protein
MSAIDNQIYELLKPKVGDHLVPDSWNRFGNNLETGDGYVDASYRGCQFRLRSVQYTDRTSAINLVVTGRKSDRDGYFRCRIEFVGDGEPSTFTSGKILIR